MNSKRKTPPRKRRGVNDPALYEFDPVGLSVDTLYWLWAEEGAPPDEIPEPFRAEYTEYLKRHRDRREAKKQASKSSTAARKRPALTKAPKAKPRKAAAKRGKSSTRSGASTSETPNRRSGPARRSDSPSGRPNHETPSANDTSIGPPEQTAGMTSQQKELYEAWLEFGHRLVPVLGDLDEDEYLVIIIKGTNHFVQFAGQGAQGMRVEAVSNYYLSEPEQLDEAQHAAMLKLGWQAPSNLPDEFGHEPVGSPNYFLDIPLPLDLAAIASLAVNTLIGPLDANHPGELEYKAVAESGERIRFPTLGLKRAGG